MREGERERERERALVVEWLERAVAMWEVSDSIPCRGGHKNLCGGWKTSDFVSFRKALKRKWFHKLNTYGRKATNSINISLQVLYTLEPVLGR